MGSVGCFGSHPEDRARARELDKYLASKESVSDERVEDYIDGILKGDGEFEDFEHGYEFSLSNASTLRKLLKAVGEQRYADTITFARALHDKLHDEVRSIL